MKINEHLRSRAVARRGPPARANAGTGFTPGTGAPERASESPPGAPLAAPESVLALQEVEDPARGRRRAVARGEDLLGELENLRLAMIEGWLSERALRRLAELIEHRGPAVDDRRLETVLREIEVRAVVEIAKREPADEPAECP